MIYQERKLKALNSPGNNKNSQQYFRSFLNHTATRKTVKLKRKQKTNPLENTTEPSCRFSIQSIT